LEQLVPAVPPESLRQIHAPYTPVAARPVNQLSGKLFPEIPCSSGFDDIVRYYDASSAGSLSFVSLTLTCSGAEAPSFSSNAHHRDS
jgi:hypothetical protein